jgi:hypothetical protein
MSKIQSPSRNTKAYLPPVQKGYEASYRCRRCRGLLRIKILIDELRSAGSMSKGEYKKQQAES